MSNIEELNPYYECKNCPSYDEYSNECNLEHGSCVGDVWEAGFEAGMKYLCEMVRVRSGKQDLELREEIRKILKMLTNC